MRYNNNNNNYYYSYYYLSTSVLNMPRVNTRS